MDLSHDVIRCLNKVQKKKFTYTQECSDLGVLLTKKRLFTISIADGEMGSNISIYQYMKGYSIKKGIHRRVLDFFECSIASQE